MGFGAKRLKFFAFSIVWASLALGGQANAAACDPGSVSLRGDWGQARFSVEVADDPAERSQGLMNREKMPAMAGMLFVYDHAQPVSFWMKNTLIPLDMIFVDETGLVKAIHENAVPLDTTPIPGGDGVKFVLEINGGMAAAMGIVPASQLSHPQIDQKIAIWPCEVQ